MKDSQLTRRRRPLRLKYIKANNERFSTVPIVMMVKSLSISRRIMKDSQLKKCTKKCTAKYIKANNERFSTDAFSRVRPC